MKHACEEISLLVSENLERQLTLREKLWMRMHFLMCAACRHYDENMSKLHVFFQLKRQLPVDETSLPVEKRKKIEHMLQDISSKE